MFNALANFFINGLRLTPLYRRGQLNAFDVKLVEHKLVFCNLPNHFDGYRILHVSDSHLDVLPELAPIAHKLLESVEVDLLVVTGDVHGDHQAPTSYSAGLLEKALSGVRVLDHRIAVLGNHDPVEMVVTLEKMGFDVLVNRSLVLERQGESIRVTGLDDVHFFYTQEARAALSDHAGEFRIALVHSPEMADYADEAGYALYLCGHTHGGQICLPGGKPVITQLTRCRHAARGIWYWGKMAGYTSCGLGVSRPPIRLNSRGEVALITLCRSPAD